MNLVYANSQRSCDARVKELRAEFGAILAERIVEAEAADFLWEARVAERYLGQEPGIELGDADAAEDLSRVAVLSCLAGDWFIAVCIVDGEGSAVELLWKQGMSGESDAREAFGSVH